MTSDTPLTNDPTQFTPGPHEPADSAATQRSRDRGAAVSPGSNVISDAEAARERDRADAMNLGPNDDPSAAEADRQRGQAQRMSPGPKD